MSYFASGSDEVTDAMDPSINERSQGKVTDSMLYDVVKGYQAHDAAFRQLIEQMREEKKYLDDKLLEKQDKITELTKQQSDNEKGIALLKKQSKGDNARQTKRNEQALASLKKANKTEIERLESENEENEMIIKGLKNDIKDLKERLRTKDIQIDTMENNTTHLPPIPEADKQLLKAVKEKKEELERKDQEYKKLHKDVDKRVGRLGRMDAASRIAKKNTDMF